MNFLQVLILALVQGAAELLPVSSSAHVIAAERLMGLDPARPEMTFLLVMLHTGTMFAVIVYFRRRWMNQWNERAPEQRRTLFKNLVLALTGTAVIGLTLKTVIEKTVFRGDSKAEIENLFGNLPLIGTALLASGILILLSVRLEKRAVKRAELNAKDALWIGGVQGVCLPFRGFSRSGATISTGLSRGLNRALVEDFSFLLAIILTPPVIARELLRLMKAKSEGLGVTESLTTLLVPGLLGMALSFLSAWLALKWLSAWLENGKWGTFGYYCLGASAFLFWMSSRGF